MPNPAFVKSGRIGEIIASAKALHSVKDSSELTTRQKLDALCATLGFSADQLDELIVTNSPVLRTVKGHAFEIFFDQLLHDAGYQVEAQGGDNPIDRVVNSFTLQLKTPTMSGTSGTTVQYKTHKTHGAKSELESMDYYHHRSHFANFLVGLITYDPLRIIVLENSLLPGHATDLERIKSPFEIVWDGHVGLNAFHLIGVDSAKIAAIVARSRTAENYLPKSAKRIGVSSPVIVDTIFREENFRIWDMNICGFAREFAFRSLLKENNITALSPTHCGRARADKADVALIQRSSQTCRHFQVKGPTFNSCNFSSKPVIAVETQLSRGRVNDHPTQSRLYLTTDFDELIIALSPPVADSFLTAIGKPPANSWQFYCVPTNQLRTHPTHPRRLTSLQYFDYGNVQKFRIDSKWLSLWA